MLFKENNRIFAGSGYFLLEENISVIKIISVISMMISYVDMASPPFYRGLLPTAMLCDCPAGRHHLPCFILYNISFYSTSGNFTSSTSAAAITTKAVLT